MKKRIISTAMIVAGVVLLMFPKVSQLYASYQQKRLMSEWQESLAIIDADPLEDTLGYQTSINPDVISVGQEQNLGEDYVKNNLDGLLSIEKINLSLPILKGVTEKNLNISVASLENSGKAGELGNYSLAAHRSYKYGRNFNRLEELEAGDKIKIDTGENTYTYIVTTKLYVKPEETWVLNSTEGAKEITLITCHPMYNPTHRLIIKGELSD